ncbi:MAG: c-type cytochrome biogenesis protein CcmI, partial [Pseudomonadota bacterium]
RIAALDAARAERPRQAAAEAQAAAARPPPPTPDARTAEIATRLRGAMAENPNDLTGLDFLARTESQLGNFAAARAAHERIVAVKGDAATTEDRLALFQAMTFAAGGYISPEAEEVLGTIIAAEPTNLTARYFQGVLELQSGRPDRVFPIWRRLLDVAPPEAPYRAIILRDLPAIAAAAGVRYEPPEGTGPTVADMIAAEDLTEDERNAMVQSMVAGLADRLEAFGGPPEDWARLVTSLGVIGDLARARFYADAAEAAYADDPAALAIIAEARARAGVTE